VIERPICFDFFLHFETRHCGAATTALLLSLFTMTKYIIVSGGVVSGIGKGVIGMRLQLSLRDSEFKDCE
jgi:hypothetical protein